MVMMMGTQSDMKLAGRQYSLLVKRRAMQLLLLVHFDLVVGFVSPEGALRRRHAVLKTAIVDHENHRSRAKWARPQPSYVESTANREKPRVDTRLRVDPERGKWVTNLGFEARRQAIGKAYAGTPTAPGEPILEWALNHIQWRDEKSKLDTVKFLVFSDMNDGFVNPRKHLSLAKVTDEGVVVSTGDAHEYKRGCGACEIWTAVTRRLRHWTFTLSQVLTGKVPEIFALRRYREDRERMMAKISCFLKRRDTWHKMYGPRGIHWHIKNISVNPEYQGQGHGLKLMRKLNAGADKKGVACYLETAGERNRHFYEKFGYNVVGHKILYDPSTTTNKYSHDSNSIVGDEAKPRLDVYLMVRPCSCFERKRTLL